MQFDNQKTRNVAAVVAKILAGESAQQEPKMLGEELKGDQHKIDANKNNKIDAHDFKLLRKKKKVEEETELAESHFKVGDKVRCKESGMDGEITKIDKEGGGEDEKYYTFKREDGKVMKKAPNEISKMNEEVHNKKKDLPFTPDTVKKPVRNSDGTIQNPMSFARELAKRAMKKVMKKEEVEEDMNLYMEMLDSIETQLREIGLLDEEQLDEISTTAAKNYLHKALPSSSKLNQKAAKPGEEAAKKLNYSSDEAPYETKEFKKFSNRRTGIRKAIDKLASAHPDNKKHATAARRAFDSIHNANYRVGMGEPNENDRANIRDVHKTVKTAVDAMHKNAMKESVGLDEAMFPGTKEYEKKYGESPQQKLKKKGDTVPTAQGEMKKTEKGVQHSRRFSEMVSAYQEHGLKYIASLVQEEPDSEEFKKELEDQKSKMDGKKKGGDVAKASVQAVKNEQTEIYVINADIANGVEEIDIEERSLTEPEMKKKEEMVKGMKKGMAGFKERYGDRAKEVIYATATSRAKGE